jgi:hypothetical protein
MLDDIWKVGGLNALVGVCLIIYALLTNREMRVRDRIHSKEKELLGAERDKLIKMIQTNSENTLSAFKENTKVMANINTTIERFCRAQEKNGNQ